MVDDAEAAQVLASFLEGESLNSLSKRLRKGKKTLASILLRAGVVAATDAPTLRKNKRRAFEIVSRYRGGESQVAIAADLGVSQPYVSQTITRTRDAYDAAFEVADHVL
jgi:hypothetical protein